MKRHALIIIGQLRPQWAELTEEEQAGFAARVRRAASAAGVTAALGYTLTTKGSFMEIWEAEDKATLEAFKHKLDALGYKKYYKEVLMLGEREAEWVAPALQEKRADS
ncbi:MAG: hypothetical protein IT331_02220 [Anaerolineae bacterium]|nr:hypothetical protein [Anaerolineae bacterium]